MKVSDYSPRWLAQSYHHPSLKVHAAMFYFEGVAYYLWICMLSTHTFFLPSSQPTSLFLVKFSFCLFICWCWLSYNSSYWSFVLDGNLMVFIFLERIELVVQSKTKWNRSWRARTAADSEHADHWLTITLTLSMPFFHY